MKDEKNNEKTLEVDKGAEVKTIEKKKKSGMVEIKCTVPCGWVIDDPKLGKRRVLDGETISFDPHDGTQLHMLIQVLRIINNPRINEVEYKIRGGNGRHEVRKKFEVLSGLENLPVAIQETRMNPKEYTNEEVVAIDSLVDKFPPFQKKEKTVIVVK